MGDVPYSTRPARRETHMLHLQVENLFAILYLGLVLPLLSGEAITVSVQSVSGPGP